MTFIKKNFALLSGGKDSTAMVLMGIEKGIKFDEIIFADTGLEFPEMYEHLENIEKYINRKILRVKPEKTFYDWFYGNYTRGFLEGTRRGFPKAKNKCWWQREVKNKPVDIICNHHNRCIGIAADEPHRFNNKPGFWYPLAIWKMTEKDCLNYIKEKGLYGKIHTRFNRTGCWLCPNQPIESLRSLYLYYPDLWKQLKVLEKDSPHGFKHGYTLDSLETYFQEGIK